MIRSTLLFATAGLAANLIARPAEAETLLPGAMPAATRIELAIDAAEDVTSGLSLVFHNGGPGPSRLVFPRRDAGSFACVADGRAAHRSRPGQFTLSPGAELRCSAEPGRYRYTILRQQNGAIHKVGRQLRVR